MEQDKAIPSSLIESIEIIREHLKVTQVNLEILEVLKLKEAISLTDKRFIEIINLDRKHRRVFEEFVLDTLPDYLEKRADQPDLVLSKTYQDWALDLIVSLSHLDKVCKEFILDKINTDKKLRKSVKEVEVKDKRFWRFLDKVKGKSRIFESFNEDSEEASLDQDS